MLDLTTYTRRAQPAAETLLRVSSGLMFAFHGAQKLFGVYVAQKPAVFSQLWIGGVIEIVCGALVAVGFLTPVWALLASGTMVVAYTQYHWKLQLDRNFFPTVNKGELALVYAAVFLFFGARGGGRYSVDGLLGAGGRDADPR
jgi:putative oxidoreductase